MVSCRRRVMRPLPGEDIFDEAEYEMVPIAEKLLAYCKANPQTAADVLTHWLRDQAHSGGDDSQKKHRQMPDDSMLEQEVAA